MWSKRLFSHRFGGIAVPPAALPARVTATVTLAQPALSASPLCSQHRAAFSLSALHLKKKKAADTSSPKSAKSQASTSPSDAPDDSKHPEPDSSDLKEFPDLISRFDAAGARFMSVVKQIRAGDVEMALTAIGNITVRTGKTEGGGQSGSHPLRDLATVVPRGPRTAAILVHDAIHVKAIVSAVQADGAFNQQPQRSPDNELELIMRISREAPEELVARIKEAAHAYREAVRQARARREKCHQKWAKEGVWLKDVKFAADKELQKKVDKRNGEVAKAETEAINALMAQRQE